MQKERNGPGQPGDCSRTSSSRISGKNIKSCLFVLQLIFFNINILSVFWKPGGQPEFAGGFPGIDLALQVQM